MSIQVGDEVREIWAARAERLAEQVLDEIKSGIDALPSVSALQAVLRIEVGELPASEMEGYPFPGEPRAVECTCPPDLVERGGFRSSCPAHGTFTEQEG